MLILVTEDKRSFKESITSQDLMTSKIHPLLPASKCDIGTYDILFLTCMT